MSEVKFLFWKKYEIPLSLAIATIIFPIVWYEFGLNFLIMAAVAILISIVFERASRYLERRNREDERLIKIGSYAAMNAMMSSVFLIFGMEILYDLHRLPAFETIDLLAIIAFIIFLVFVLWCAHYFYKGDVE